MVRAGCEPPAKENSLKSLPKVMAVVTSTFYLKQMLNFNIIRDELSSSPKQRKWIINIQKSQQKYIWVNT